MARWFLALLLGSAAACAPVTEGPPPRPVHLEARFFPESLTSTSDGTLLIGSTEKGGVYRAAPGAGRAEPWIRADATNRLATVFGVLADEAAGLLWLCSNDLAQAGQGTAIKSFDLDTGVFVASYELPGGGMCNDMAVDGQGTLYATDMAGRVLRLPKGGAALESWLQHAELNSADGIAVLPDGRVLVNTFGPGKLLSITPSPEGAAGPLTEIRPSRPLVQPDGMRIGPGDAVYLVEGDGKVDRLVLSGDRAEVITIAEGFESPTGITFVGATPWIVEGKTGYRMDPALRDQDPGAFRAIPLSPEVAGPAR